MRVFVTGATGFIGSAVVRELLQKGHKVLGMTRSEVGAKALEAAGAEVHSGELTDLESLRRGAAAADGVIHTAFIHDFSKFQENCEIDRSAIEAMGEVLSGSGKALIVTSGTGALQTPGRLMTEEDMPSATTPRLSEQTGSTFAARGVRAITIRLPQVHDPLRQGFVSYLIDLARKKGFAGYPGDGSNRWPACHRLDAAHLYCLALEKGTAGARYNAVGEEGVPLRGIAEAIAKGLKIPAKSLTPEEAAEYFGWMNWIASADCPASSALTQKWLDWHPSGPTMLEDLAVAEDFKE